MTTASVQRDGFEGILFPGSGRKDKVLMRARHIWRSG